MPQLASMLSLNQDVRAPNKTGGPGGVAVVSLRREGKEAAALQNGGGRGSAVGGTRSTPCGSFHGGGTRT